MAYVSVPKDMSKVKPKVMFNLTARQLVCFGTAALVGLPAYFLSKPLGNSASTMLMIVIMLPFFLLAMYEKNGQPLERVLGNIVRVSFLRAKRRPYKTQNYYDLLMKQAQLDKEVQAIVSGIDPQTKAGHTGRSEARKSPR